MRAVVRSLVIAAWLSVLLLAWIALSLGGQIPARVGLPGLATAITDAVDEAARLAELRAAERRLAEAKAEVAAMEAARATAEEVERRAEDARRAAAREEAVRQRAEWDAALDRIRVEVAQQRERDAALAEAARTKSAQDRAEMAPRAAAFVAKRFAERQRNGVHEFDVDDHLLRIEVVEPAPGRFSLLLSVDGRIVEAISKGSSKLPIIERRVRGRCKLTVGSESETYDIMVTAPQ